MLRADMHGGLHRARRRDPQRSLAHVLERLSAQALRRPHHVAQPRACGRGRDRRPRRQAACPVDIEELPDGEPAKRLDEQEPLFRRLAGRQLERRDPLIAIGDDAAARGGDVRGGRLAAGRPPGRPCPVTTLGLIDTAIGGKGGIDLPGVGRNLLGAIHQPTATILDVGARGRRAAATSGVRPSRRP